MTIGGQCQNAPKNVCFASAPRSQPPKCEGSKFVLQALFPFNPAFRFRQGLESLKRLCSVHEAVGLRVLLGRQSMLR